MAGKLAERLKRIKDADALSAPKKKAEPQHEGKPLAGWKRIAPFVLERWIEARIEFPATLDLAPFLVPRLSPLSAHRAGPLPIDRAGLVFIDTETTGLSTGAGTYIFAFGAGSFLDGKFRLRQLFLEDYPGEPDFLEAAASSLSEAKRLVSYNGRSFDIPLLRTRFAMNGMRYPEPAQVDLLHSARRLWAKSLGGASLKTVEEGVLGFLREDDVPGSEAPERYLRYLRSKDADEVLPVLNHHAQDILSLPRLMAAAATCFDDPCAARVLDKLKAGIVLYKAGRAAWEDCLLSGARGGEGACLRCLVALYRHEGRWEEGFRLLGEYGRAFEDYLLLAKIAEHRMKDFRLALKFCGKALKTNPTSVHSAAMEVRIARLRRKSEYR